jgi:ATP:ADP antiporter, AAA family
MAKKTSSHKGADIMNASGRDIFLECAMRYPLLRSPGVRAGLFFLNFFLAITALYQLKPASRSLFIEYMGSASLPYVWIAVALSMGLFIWLYHRLVARLSRQRVVMGSVLMFGIALLLFRVWFFYPGKVVAIAFYVFVDILGVVLVEQFWSLVNSVYSTMEGKSWYGFVGTGGLLGGVTGGGISALLVRYTPMKTDDLLISAAVTLFIVLTLTVVMGRCGLFCEVDETRTGPAPAESGQVTGFKRYLILIAGILLLAQLVSPITEYLFMNTVESSYVDVDARTAFLSLFYGLVNVVSIGVNLLVTPTVNRFFGPIAGLLAQPLAIITFSIMFLFNATLFFAGAIRIGDRGLSYSINRASRELLYVPIGSLLIYRAKAWIDMLGYRLFKALGSALILVVTGLSQVSSHFTYLSLTAILGCGIWLLLVGFVSREYRVVNTE